MSVPCRLLRGRRFFFGTKADLAPGLRAVEQAIAIQYVVQEMRDDEASTVIDTLSSDSRLGLTMGNQVMTSPIYLIFRRGEVPRSSSVPQHGGGMRYTIDTTSNCVRLLCGGLHADSGALIAGELQEPLSPDKEAKGLFRFFARELFRGFTRVRLYWVGPEALQQLRAGQRLVTIGIGSPREYDLTEP